MSKKIFRISAYILAIILLLFGIAVFCYPLISGQLSERKLDVAIENFNNLKSALTDNVPVGEGGEEEEDGEVGEEDNNIKKNESQIDKLYYDMKQYNDDIYENGQKKLCDAWVYEQASINLSAYGIYDSMVGILKVPAMNNLEIPLYLGASKENMSKGAVQLGETSMPIGGENTNCVIAGHRGWNGARYFLDIEQLQIGDMVYIENLWSTLIYKVTDIKIIQPNDIDSILIQEGKDMVTLFTCHPYWASTYRYVVFCTRADGDTPTENQTVPQTSNIEEAKPSEYVQSPLENTEYVNEAEKNDALIDNTSQYRIVAERISYIAVPIILFCVILIIFIVNRKKE